jgi:hypothetical protein
MGIEASRKDYDGALAIWERCRDVISGSDAVKSRGARYLPPLDSQTRTASLAGEGARRYAEYLLRALFFNATGRTVVGLSGAMFQKEPQLKCGAEAKKHVEDVTLSGLPLASFALELGKQVIGIGRAGVLVEMSTAKPGVAPRPYWCMYKAEDVPSWVAVRADGQLQLMRVVLRECEEVPDPKDPFAVVEAVMYRELTLLDPKLPGFYKQNIWRESEPGKSDWSIVEEIVPTKNEKPMPFIPFTFVGPTSTSPDIEKCPVIDLVDVNLSHYRTMADLEHGLHFTALPTPWVKGSAGESTEPLSIGSGVVWMLDADGGAGMLEFTGSGLKALEEAAARKEKTMSALGARFIEDQKSNETLGAVVIRHSGDHASLSTVARSVGEACTLALRWHEFWIGVSDDPRSSKSEYRLSNDFFSTKMSSEDLRTLVQALQAEAISYETFYAQLEKGEITRPGVTAKQELDEIVRQREEAIANDPSLDPETGLPLNQDPNADPNADDPENPPQPGEKKKVPNDDQE